MPRREVKFLVDWMACCKTNSNNNVKHKTGKGGERSHIDRLAKEGRWMACCKTNSNNNVKHKTGKGGERSHIDRHAKEGSEVSCGVDGMLLDKKKQLCEAKEVGRG